MLISVLEQSLLFFPLALGIFISYGVLRIPDLATDGSFVFGAALYAVCIHAGFNPMVALFAAMFGGTLCGMIVSLLQIRLNLTPLIAGILLVFILNTLVLKVMGRPNLSLFDFPSLFTLRTKLFVLLGCGMALMIAVFCLLASRIGLCLHAFGNNPMLLNFLGKRANGYRMLGLSVSNGLAGFSGALTAQASGYADISMGAGIVLIALGTVIIGQQIYRIFFKALPFTLFCKLFSCFFGVVLYFFTIQFLISLGCDPIYLRLMIGICLIAFLAMTHEKQLTKGYAL